MARPRVNTSAQKAIEKAKEQFDRFDQEVKNLTQDEMSKAPLEQHEPQTRMSANEIKKSTEVYLKPIKTIYPGCDSKTGKMTDVFNESFRDQYEYDKKYVRFIAENHEIIGESIDIWTRPYPGTAAEEWLVPANVPVWGPRYLAEQIKRKCYHVLTMEDHKQVGSDHTGTYVGGMVAKATRHRLDAKPCPEAHIAFNRKVSNF